MMTVVNNIQIDLVELLRTKPHSDIKTSIDLDVAILQINNIHIQEEIIKLKISVYYSYRVYKSTL